MNDSLFIAVDLQRDFMDEEGGLYIEGSDRIKNNIRKLFEYINSKKRNIVCTKDVHSKFDVEISNSPDYKITFPEHCIRNSDGADFIKEVVLENPLITDFNIIYENSDIKERVRNRENVFYKNTTNIFNSNIYFERFLYKLKPQKIYVFGVATEICVNNIVVELIKRNYNISVIVDSIYGINEKNIAFIINEWAKSGVKLNVVSQIIGF